MLFYTFQIIFYLFSFYHFSLINSRFFAREPNRDGVFRLFLLAKKPENSVPIWFAMLSGVFDNYWNQTETYEVLKSYIKLNYDGLKDAVVRMLAGDKVQVNTGTFSNDMTSFQGKDDVLTLLIHLGYLSYHWPDKTVTIPNKEVSQEYINAISTMDWSEVTASVEASRLRKRNI